MILILLLLWGLFALTAMVEVAPFCKNLKMPQHILVIILIFIGGPFFAFTNIL